MANLVFIIVPLLLCIFMFFRLAEIHSFYFGWYDPNYAYLFNGLTFALGSNDIGLIEHPGTPLQLFCGVIIKIASLFRGISSEDLANDVIEHPELYLRVISLSLIFINCLFIWLLGLFSFKKMGSSAMAVALQLSPLISFELVKYLPIVACETVIIFSSIAIATCIILYDRSSKNQRLLLVALSLFSALSVSTKITSALIILIPFIFLKGYKLKAFYLMSTVLLLFVFVSPVLSKLGNLINFIKSIATHTGSYGSGSEMLIDWGIFFRSMKTIITKDFILTLHLLLLLAGWFFIVKRQIKGTLTRIYVGITLTTLFQIIIVSRHYGFHYLMPIFALAIPLHIYFWIRVFHTKISSIPTRTTALVMIVLATVVFARLIIKNEFQKGIISPVYATDQLIKSEMNAPFIILSKGGYGGAFINPALHFGLGYSGGSIRPTYKQIVDNHYRGNYLWNSNDGFFDWQQSYLPVELFSKHTEFYIYECYYRGEAPMSTIKEMVDKTGITDYITLKKVYENPRSKETIALATVDTSILKKLQTPLFKIETDIELFSEDRTTILSKDRDNLFRGGQLSTEHQARSGAVSVLLTPSSPFGLNLAIPKSSGTKFKAEIWQKSNTESKALIVASSNNGKLLYKTSSPANNVQDGWTRSELVFVIPDDYPEETINFYMWNPTPDSVWVDDFSISVFP